MVTTRTRTGRVGWAALLLVAVAIAAVGSTAHAATPKNGKVAILSTSIANDVIAPPPGPTEGLPSLESLEAYEAQTLGLVADVIKPEDWAKMTTSDFSQYNAIVIGDPKCNFGNLTPAVSSASIWGAAVDGNVAILGNAPVTTFWLNQDLSSRVGSGFEVLGALAHATADPGKTGAYVTVGCSARNAGADTAIHLLDGLGSFAATGSNGACWNTAHIVNPTSALAMLNDGYLSGWPCAASSALEVFTSYPADYTPFANAENGSPYILLRGSDAGPVGKIVLGPAADESVIGEQHTVNAVVTEGESPVAGVEVFFVITQGPNAGMTFGNASTDAAGIASWTYDDVSGLEGTDTIQATHSGSDGIVRYSNDVTETWTSPAAPDTTAPSITLGSPADGASVARNAVVNASYSCADEAGGSGLASCSGDVANGAPIDTSSLGAHTFTVNASDTAGNTSSVQHSYTVVDATPPSITLSTPAAGASYALNQAVSASYSCADEAGGSGLATCTGPVPSGTAIDTSAAGPHTFTVNASDNAGNPSSTTSSYTVLADTTAPTISIVTPPDNATYNLGQVVTASYSCADTGGSGLATCTGPVANGAAIDTASAGVKTFTVSATDGAGNPSTATVHYTVAAPPPPTGTYTIKGEGTVGNTLWFAFEAKSGPKRPSGEVVILAKGHIFLGTVTGVSVNGSTAIVTGTGYDNLRRVNFTLTVTDAVKDTLFASFGTYTGGGTVTEGSIRIRP